MKIKSILLSAILFLSVASIAQTDSTITNLIDNTDNNEIKTIFNNPISHGGYFGISTNYAFIEGENAILMGARAAWIINHSLSLGFVGYGFANDIYLDNVVDNTSMSLVGGYGGLLIEPIVGAKLPVHLSFPVVLGFGGAAYYRGNGNYYNSEDGYYGTYEDTDAFMIVEPGIELEVNIIKHIRFAVGASYRKTADLNLYNTAGKALDGLSYGFTMKFGKF